MLNANTPSICLYLGDGLLGLFAFTVTQSMYDMLSETWFIPPVNWGPMINIPPTVIQTQSSTIRATFNKNTIALKQLLIGTIDNIFITGLKHHHDECVNVTTLQLLAHLYQIYSNITPGNLINNQIECNEDYNANLLIETIVGRIKNCVNFA